MGIALAEMSAENKDTKEKRNPVKTVDLVPVGRLQFMCVSGAGRADMDCKLIDMTSETHAAMEFAAKNAVVLMWSIKTVPKELWFVNTSDIGRFMFVPKDEDGDQIDFYFADGLKVLWEFESNLGSLLLIGK